MGYADHSFEVHGPDCREGGWWFVVRGERERRHGPYPTGEAATRAAHELFQRFQVRARARGGWAWRRTAAEWVVTLPVGTACGGLPFTRTPCARSA